MAHVGPPQHQNGEGSLRPAAGLRRPRNAGVALRFRCRRGRGRLLLQDRPHQPLRGCRPSQTSGNDQLVRKGCVHTRRSDGVGVGMRMEGAADAARGKECGRRRRVLGGGGKRGASTAGTVEGGNKKEKTRSARLGATHVGKASASEAKQDLWVTSGCPPLENGETSGRAPDRHGRVPAGTTGSASPPLPGVRHVGAAGAHDQTPSPRRRQPGG